MRYARPRKLKRRAKPYRAGAAPPRVRALNLPAFYNAARTRARKNIR